MDDSKKLWGGRFTEEPDETFVRFNNSFGFDKRLFFADVRASIAHAGGLVGAGVLTDAEYFEIKKALTELQNEAERNAGYFDGSNAEDIHSFIEEKLVAKIGDLGKKLHTGRSRNDQVATAFRLWLREEIEAISNDAKALQKALVDIAEQNKDEVIPGYTHLQRAQLILFAHWCLAYFEMLKRDRERLAEVHKRTNILPLGSAALAGTSFDIDRKAVAKELGFEDVSANSLDAVSDRDFAIEFLGACSLVMVHLSRLAEDLILYASSEFKFIELSDKVSTGSSLMPQKKNPDSLELIRGKAGRIFGHQMALLTTVKGLPMAYNKDLQEDKEAVFDTVDNVSLCLKVAAIVMRNITIDAKRGLEAATTGYLNATELADYLVRKGVPFRTAHEVTGKIVVHAISKNAELNELNLDEMQKFSSDIGGDVFNALNIEQTLARKNQIGGTSRSQVLNALKAARDYLEE